MDSSAELILILAIIATALAVIVFGTRADVGRKPQRNRYVRGAGCASAIDRALLSQVRHWQYERIRHLCGGLPSWVWRQS